MAPDSFSEISHEGWFSRIGSSIKGVLFGLLLFVAAFPLLWWNEGRAVKTARSLEEGSGVVVSVAATPIVAANEGKLVHVTGTPELSSELIDREFSVSVTAVKLRRTVEMYQWHEEKREEKRKKTGGGTVTKTTYSYDTRWAENLIDSAQFKRPEGHQNPSSLPYSSQTMTASEVMLGDFFLSDGLIDDISGFEPHRLDRVPEVFAGQAAEGGSPVLGFQLADGGLYRGANPAQPEIGDIRVRFSVVRPAPISVVARQSGTSFAPYQTDAGRALEMLEMGTLDAAQMFQAAAKRNTILTWVLRFVGFFVMFLGLTMIFKPMVVVADVLPILGNLLGMGLGLFAAVIAGSLSFLVIAIAWLAYRPLLGGGLLVLAAVPLVLAIMAVRKRKARAAVAVPPPPPPPPAS